MVRLVQLAKGKERCVALVEEPRLRIIARYDSLYALASAAIAQRVSLTSLAQASATGPAIDYEAVYAGRDAWQLQAPFDHPTDPARCLVTGTGLTHLGSAHNRQSMHRANDAELTDSMRMFRWGVERGKPAPGQIGVSPEWFFKGAGDILKKPGESISIPNYAGDGGEEAEIAGIYLIGPDGQPWRVGMAAGNEFSDHKFEKTNYLNLASSKIRQCSLGPELVVNADFHAIHGEVAIERGSEILWSKQIATGESEMCHSLANIEHHHFKHAGHRRPGDAHIHYFGAHSLSFGDGIRLADGDVMVVRYDGFGRALRNPVHVDTEVPKLVHTNVLT